MSKKYPQKPEYTAQEVRRMVDDLPFVTDSNTLASDLLAAAPDSTGTMTLTDYIIYMCAPKPQFVPAQPQAQPNDTLMGPILQALLDSGCPFDKARNGAFSCKDFLIANQGKYWSQFTIPEQKFYHFLKLYVQHWQQGGNQLDEWLSKTSAQTPPAPPVPSTPSQPIRPVLVNKPS